MSFFRNKNYEDIIRIKDQTISSLGAQCAEHFNELVKIRQNRSHRVMVFGEACDHCKEKDKQIERLKRDIDYHTGTGTPYEFARYEKKIADLEKIISLQKNEIHITSKKYIQSMIDESFLKAELNTQKIKSDAWENAYNEEVKKHLHSHPLCSKHESLTSFCEECEPHFSVQNSQEMKLLKEENAHLKEQVEEWTQKYGRLNHKVYKPTCRCHLYCCPEANSIRSGDE